jgi:hypothetical protein
MSIFDVDLKKGFQDCLSEYIEVMMGLFPL